jgi:hypothetical protein
MTDGDWNERWALRRVGDCWYIIDAETGETVGQGKGDPAGLCRSAIEARKTLQRLGPH